MEELPMLLKSRFLVGWMFLYTSLGFAAQVKQTAQVSVTRQDLTVSACWLTQDYICTNCNLDGADLSDYCSIRNISGSSAVDANLEGVSAQDAAFDNTNLALAYANEGNFRNASFYGADFHETRFHQADFQGAQFKPANSFNAEFHDANLTDARLKGNFAEAAFAGADFSDANMSGAKMRGAKFNADTIFSNTNVQGTDFRGVNDTRITFFTGADLVGMVGVPITDANMDWEDATCPDGTAANANGGVPTCVGHFVP
jgi:uncharacterized protein YjbI with pentapeptide repeats